MKEQAKKRINALFLSLSAIVILVYCIFVLSTQYPDYTLIGGIVVTVLLSVLVYLVGKFLRR